MTESQFGVVGLAVMGRNLARNIAGHGIPTVVYNRTGRKTRDFLNSEARDLPIVGAESVQTFVQTLARPRRILLMVQAGGAVDNVLTQLTSLLEPGDIVLDGGNSHFQDTRRRQRELAAAGIRFLGMGVSGGETGALRGPALMPGGPRDAYETVAPVLTAIAAHVDGDPCCAWLGPDGAGHYVKMVHNGIEYADMELIAEAYDLLAHLAELEAPDLADVFAAWNETELESFLIEITARILRKRDDGTGRPLVDLILDKAGQKGTGKWTAQAALDLGVYAPTIAEAVFARAVSARHSLRQTLGARLQGVSPGGIADRQVFIHAVRQALYAAKVCSYAQGFELLRAAAEAYEWPLPFAAITRVWRGGCIIRARFLQRVAQVFDAEPQLPHLLLAPEIARAVTTAETAWRQVVATAVSHGLPVPAFGSALAYYDAYRRRRLPANLIQAQRDYFGAHTYERTDQPGTFHTDWE